MVCHKTANFLICLMISGFIPNALAETADQVTVQLNSLKKIKQQEKSGDELYISVTEFAKNQKPRFHQIPRFPAHWTSDNLDGIKDVVLWKKAMKTCTPTTVIFSLVEEDLPPWNTDDLVGSVQLQISCTQGKMKTEWKIPNANRAIPVSGNKNAFEMTGERAKYLMNMNIIKNKVPLEAVKQQTEQPIQIRERLYFP